MLNKPKNDFAEMFLHHLATAILIMGSYMTNSFCGGAVVMFVLDHADVWIGMIRVVMDACSTPVISLVAFCFGTMFVYTRIIVFPFEVIKYTAFD